MEMLAKQVHNFAHAPKADGFHNTGCGNLMQWNETILAEKIEQFGVADLSNGGRRLGQPAEETSMYATWSANTCKPMWALPHVGQLEQTAHIYCVDVVKLAIL